MVTGHYAKGLLRRQEIIDVATDAFSRAGFEGTSIVAIAADAGISRAGLLHHFESKEELLMAVLTSREDADRQIFIDSGSRARGGVGVLRGMVRLAQANETRPGLVRLFVVLGAESVEPSHPAHEYFRAHYERILTGTTAALDSARTHERLRADIDPQAFATELVALQDGLQLQWLLRPEQVRIAETLEARIQSALTRDLWQD